MSKIQKIILSSLALALVNGALWAQSVYVVKIYDLQKEVSNQIMTREQLAKLKNDLQLEARFFQTALVAAKKEWAENDLYSGTTFPGGLSPRRAQEQGPFSEDMAKKKVASMDAQQAAMVIDARKLKEMKPKQREIAQKRMERDMELKTKLAPASAMLQAHIERLMKGEPKEAPKQ